MIATPLAIGSRLGPYTVTARLGAGGMGEVWRATDTRLGREVALKVLPEDFAVDPDRHARFEREAKVLASLNHPHIATLYGLEHLDVSAGSEPEARSPEEPHVERASRALHVLVMELVDGEGLDERIGRGAIPVDEAIPIALQIAEALEAAHERGIVHRDLKPANIRVRPDGTVKVLDFGLAKAADAAAQSDPSHSPTMTRGATQAGLILGTAAYMAPEQARGRSVDKRADIWAFGVVLHEMLTGRRMFDGETVSDVLAGVLRADVDLEHLPPETPAAVHRLLRRCLVRDPSHRLRDIGDAVLELGEAARDESPEKAPTLPGVPAGRSGRRLAGAALAVALAATAVAVWALTRHPRATAVPAPTVSFDPKTFDQQVIYSARFLPGGRGIVYSAALTGNVPELFMLPAGESAPRKLAPLGTQLLSVSAGGELAVLTGASFVNHRVLTGTLARMSVDGSPRPLVEGVRDADWGPDGSLAIVRRVGGADRLEYPIGTVLYETPGYVSEPRVSADGKLVAFLDHQWWLDDRGWLKVVDRSRHISTLSEEYWAIEGLAWSTDPTVLYFSGADGALNLQPRVARLGAETTRKVLETPGQLTVLDVDRSGDWLAIEEDERYAVVAHLPGSGPELDLTWLDSCWGAELSPDGQTLLFSSGRGGANYSVVTRRLDGSPITTLGEGDSAGFSPDGRWVAAKIAAPPGVVLYPTGAGSPRILERGPIEQYQNVQWFPDSTHLLLSGNEPSRPVRAWRQAIDGGLPEPVTPEGIDGTVRPDGQAILALDADGAWRQYPTGGGAPRPTAGLRPTDFIGAWSADGSAVFVYRTGDVPIRIERVDLASGKRTPALTIAPEQRTGLVRIYLSCRVLDPARAYAYGYLRRLSKLFVVQGAGR